MPQIDELAIAALNPATPADERADINAELWRTFKHGIEVPDQDEIRSYLPTLTKASYLEPFYEPYVVGKRTTQTHTAILYLNEYGVVDHGDGTSRYLEKPSIGGFRFLKDVVTTTDIVRSELQRGRSSKYEVRNSK